MRIDAGISSFLDGVFGTEKKNQVKLDKNDIRELSDKLGLSREGTKQLVKVLLDADANVGASIELDREDGGTVSVDVGADIKITIDSPKGTAVYTLVKVDGSLDVSLKDNSDGRLGLSADLLANVSSGLLKGISLVLDGALDISRGNIDLSLGGNLNLDNPIFNRFRQS